MTKVLFINGQSDRHWIESLEQTALCLGESLELADHQHLEGVSFQNYALIIIDAGAVNNPISTVRHIRSCNSQVRIVMVSSTPHWKQARETLLAGATDYVRKVDGREAILDILRGSLFRMREGGS